MATKQQPIHSGFGPLTTAREAIADRRLDGLTAIVTGGSAGIGLETTRVLSTAGDKVIVPARSTEKARTALAGLERWKAKHPDVVAKLAPEDVLVDTNRGRATAWYRVRINLKNVPEAERPAAETPDPNYDPHDEWG